MAGHSQGSRLCYMVLSEYMKEHPDYYSGMIAAYCLGDSLTKAYLEANPHVKAAQAAELNLGSYKPYLLFPRLKKLRVNADAVIDPERGTVIVTEPKLKNCVITAVPGLKKMEPVFGPASYHGCDYSFFYKNIRRNARTRIKAWFANSRK